MWGYRNQGVKMRLLCPADDAAATTTTTTVTVADSPVISTAYKMIKGCAVFAECNLADVEVYLAFDSSTKRNRNYSVTLALVDVEKNKNNFVRMQLLFSSIGRVSKFSFGIILNTKH